MAAQLHTTLPTFQSPQPSQDEWSGASYNLILEHVLSYSGTYELPLRTMYTINSTPRSQLSRPTTPTGNKTPTSPQLPTDTQLASADLQSSLLTQISKQRSQPCSLPPAFITNFLRKCFPYELELVDFPQALTALDYLKDLDKRRKRELAGALNRLGVSKESLQHDPDEHLQRHPGVAVWLKNSVESERKIEAYYSKLFVALRRWILINELTLQPFLKHNCLAMLNTLYPPLATNHESMGQHTNPMLTNDLLEQQRKGFFEWIGQVEKNGSRVLERLMQVGARVGEPNGWPSVRSCLDDYLRVANMIIDECMSISSPEDLNEDGTRRRDSKETPKSADSRGSRKADSGVSFTTKDGSHTSSKRPSTSDSDVNKELPPQPPLPTPTRPNVSYDIGRAKTGGSTLERIAREFRRIRPQLSPMNTKIDSQRPAGQPETSHWREDSDCSDRSRNVTEERTGRGRSRSNVFRRSMSRMRARSKSRSRPSTATGIRPPDDDIPPTPSLPPAGLMSAFDDDDDDDDDDGRSGRGRFRRSLSLSRARSSSRSSSVFRKVKNFGDAKGRDYRVGSDESFESEEMRMKREAWQAGQRRQKPAIGAAM